MGSSNEDLYELQWNNHAKILKGSFDIFRTDNELIDVTLSCEGKKLKAHKIVLSACSLYFLDLFRENPCKHPIVIMRDIKYQAMVDILNFMYNGEVNIATDDLQTFLKTAEYLQVKGLTEKLPKKINLPTNFVNNSETINTEKSVNDKIANLKRKCKKIIENIEISDSIIIDDNENDPLVKDSSENDAMEVTNEPENSNTDDEKNVSLSPKGM